MPHSAYRLEVFTRFNCRAKRGERRDKSGALIKASIWYGATLAECLADAREARAAGERIAPGYSSVVDVRGFDDAVHRADPLNAKPEYHATTL